jgi:photosystem II stability/assembly factor-like uncharacterized protein
MTSTATTFRTVLSFLLSALLIAALGGCATPSAIGGSSSLGDNQGVVTLRIVSLHGTSLQVLQIRNLETQEIVKLVPRAGLGGGSYRFTGIVPAGRYRTLNVYGRDQYGSTIFTIDVPLDERANKFEVQSGHLTNLGTIVFAPTESARFVGPRELTRELTSGRFVAPREPTPVAAREWLEFANPKLAASLNPSRELGWSEAPSAEEREINQRRIQYAQSTIAAAALPDSLAVGKLGVVFESRGGESNRYQLGTVNQILSAVRLTDGRLLAVGEEGYMAVSSPDRKTWRELPAPGSRASVGYLVTQAADRTVYLATGTPRGAVVYSADPDTLAWKELRRFERSAPASGVASWFGQYHPAAVVTRDRLVVYTPDPELLSSYDFSTKTWEAYRPSTSVARIMATADGLIFVRSATSSDWSTLDYGKSWSRLENFVLATMPLFTDRSTAYVLAKPFEVLKGPSFGLFKSTDGAKTWTRIGGAPDGGDAFGRLAYDRGTQRLAYQFPGGRLAWTSDEGKSWR